MSPDARANLSRYGEWGLLSLAALCTLFVVAMPLSRLPLHRRLSRLSEQYRSQASGQDTGLETASQPASPQLEKIGQRNVFAPPPPKGFKATLTGVLGDAAIFDGKKLVRAGESYKKAKVTQIGPDWVEIDFEGELKKLHVFGAGAPRPPPQPASQPAAAQEAAQEASPAASSLPEGAVVREPTKQGTTKPAPTLDSQPVRRGGPVIMLGRPNRE